MYALTKSKMLGVFGVSVPHCQKVVEAVLLCRSHPPSKKTKHCTTFQHSRKNDTLHSSIRPWPKVLMALMVQAKLGPEVAQEFL